MDSRTAPPAALIAAVAVGLLALLAAASRGAPYLSADAVNPWIVVFAVALLGALLAVPFAIERRVRGQSESDARWERALLGWGAVAVAAGLAGIVLGASADWASGASLAGAVGLLVTIESALVLATMLVWLLSGG